MIEYLYVESENLKETNMKYNVDGNETINEMITGMGYIQFQSLKDANKTNKNVPISNSRYIKTISYEEFKKMLNNDYINTLLRRRKKIRVFESDAINLISTYRYDVFIKYYYVKEYLEKGNYDLAKAIYLNHLQSFNNFTEPDGKKNGAKVFIASFDSLIKDIKKNGINKTIIPITKNGEIIDGAHRLAIALYLKLKIRFAIFNLLDANYNKDFFINRGFNSKYAEIIDKEVVKKIK